MGIGGVWWTLGHPEGSGEGLGCRPAHRHVSGNQGRGSSMKTRGAFPRGLRSYRRKQGQGRVDDTIDAIASVTLCW